MVSIFAHARIKRSARDVQAGFTLIELMVVVALVGILAIMAGPLTSSWVDNAKLDHVVHLLSDGYGRAEAAALRNRQGIINGGAAAVLCLSSAGLALYEAVDENTSASCSGSAIWSASLPSDVQISAGSTALSCLAFNNQGLLATPSGSSCQNSASVVVSVGTNSVQADLH